MSRTRREWVSLRINPLAVALIQQRATEQQQPASTIWREVIGAGLEALGMVESAPTSSPIPSPELSIESGG